MLSINAEIFILIWVKLAKLFDNFKWGIFLLLTLYSRIKCDADLDKFQESLDMLSDRANLWQLSISVNKCCTMDISSNNKLSLDPNHCNSVANIDINNANQIRDLGVEVDSKL